MPVHNPIPLHIIHFNITFKLALNTASGLLSSGVLKSYLHVLSLAADTQIGKRLHFQLTWTYMHIYVVYTVRGGADKSLARPGRKQATATKLGIYSTHSPRSSTHFLVRCSNFCKPLKKIQKFVRPTRSPRQQ